MTTDDKLQERLTWLRYEFSAAIEQFLHGEMDASQMAESAAKLSPPDEVENIGDELLRHSHWAMQHVKHRPACWAPTREEIEYLLVCLREEETFDPDQVEFTYLSSDDDLPDCC